MSTTLGTGKRCRCTAFFTFDALDKGNKLANAIDSKQPATLKGENTLVEGHRGKAMVAVTTPWIYRSGTSIATIRSASRCG